MLTATAVSFVPDVATQVVRGTVAAVPSFTTTADSHVYSKIVVKAATQDLFEARELQMRLLSTKDMLKAISMDEAKVTLSPLPEFNEPDSWQDHEDPRYHWMQALKNFVSPLDYDAPEYSKQESRLKKTGA